MASPFPQSNAPHEGESADGRAQREVAQRVFAAEFNASNMEYKDGGERSPAYVVSPLGAKINRLLVIGVLTSNEKIGTAGDMWRAQVIDPTGTFNVYAGQYQPEAASALADLKPPAVVAVIGKARTYSPETGVTYTSIRPEAVRAVSVEDRDRWIVETAKHTLTRLEAAKEAAKLGAPTAEKLESMGFAKEVADGVARALAHYGTPETTKYAGMIRDALESLLQIQREHADAPPAAAAPALGPSFATAAPPARPAPAAPKPAAAPAKPASPAAPAAKPAGNAEAERREEIVLALAEKLDDGKGAPWEEIVSAAAKDKITEEQVEEALNSLMDKGAIYEPVLGRLKKT